MKYFAFAAALAASPALADQAVSGNFAGEIAGKPFSCSKTFEGIGAKATAVTLPTTHRVDGVDGRSRRHGQVRHAIPAQCRTDGTVFP